MGKVKKVREKLGRVKELMLEYAYLITLGAVVAVVAASAMYANSVRTQFEAQRSQPVEAAADAPEIAQTASPSARPTLTPLPTIAPLVIGSFGSGAGRVWPVGGEVIRAHAPQEVVFWEALSCYQTHTGTDIAGIAGEEVRLIMDGVVERVTRDELWGYCIRVAQTDGSAVVYAGIATCFVMDGQAVTRGQTLGLLMDAIPCEAELGAHLHLELEKDGQAADPEELLKTAKRE